MHHLLQWLPNKFRWEEVCLLHGDLSDIPEQIERKYPSYLTKPILWAVVSHGRFIKVMEWQTLPDDLPELCGANLNLQMCEEK